MKSFSQFINEDGVAATTTAGISGAGDNPDKTVPVSKDTQKKYKQNGLKTDQLSLRRRQSMVNTVKPSGMSEETVEEGIKVNDKGHLGFAVKGGLGFKGTIAKIDKDTVILRSDTPSKFGPKEHRGHKSKFTKDA